MARLLLLTLALCAPAWIAEAQQPPTQAVRAALAQLGPDVTACTLEHLGPNGGRARRVRVRVWLEPTGQVTIDVPELADPSLANRAAALACLQRALLVRIAPHVRAFSGRTRVKVERVFSVRPPALPPSSARLSALVARRRTQLVACVPGNGARGGRPAELVVRARLDPDGSLHVVGLGAPEGAPFDAVSECVARELANVRHDPVTRAATFETALRFRYLAPAPI